MPRGKRGLPLLPASAAGGGIGDAAFGAVFLSLLGLLLAVWYLFDARRTHLHARFRAKAVQEKSSLMLRNATERAEAERPLN